MGIQTIIIKDERLGGEGEANSFTIDFNQPVVTVADIITERVTQEVANYHKKADTIFRGLIQPTEMEATLNGFKSKTGRAKRINLNAQIKTALKAFQGNGFLLLIDDQQAETLDEKVSIRPNMEIVFLKLTPLVGG